VARLTNDSAKAPLSAVTDAHEPNDGMKGPPENSPLPASTQLSRGKRRGEQLREFALMVHKVQ
jgi:hypothetical protein